MKSNVANTKHGQSEGLNGLLAVFLHKMQQVQSMVFESKSQQGSAMRWSGRAEACVTSQVEAITPNGLGDATHATLKLYEKGFFYPDQSTKPLPFSNCFKLVFQQDNVGFYHERFGAAHGVWLFDLIAGGDEASLVSQQPHACGKDHYLVKVEMREDGVKMQWQIKGPKKNELLDYHYSIKSL